ncbi:hypothetical protein QQ045_017344 [Rhodiola kirilowii]
MKMWCEQIIEVYKNDYLRFPNAADLSRLLRKTEQRGFPGRKGHPTIILEAVASYDTWIWHNFIGVPRAQNDINVLYKLDIFDPLLVGISPRVTYKVNGSTYDNSYYLADGIYPRYSALSKQFLIHKLIQRSYLHRNKNLIVKMWKGVLGFYNPVGQYFVPQEEFVEHEEEDLYNPSFAFTVYDGSVDPNGSRIHHDSVERAERLEAFHNRLITLQSAYLHTQLQSDLVKHNWAMATSEEL